MKTKPQSLLAIACLGLILTNSSPGADAAPGAMPAPPAPVSPASKPLPQEGLIGAWVGVVHFPKDRNAKVTLRPATDQEVDQLLGGKRPE